MMTGRRRRRSSIVTAIVSLTVVGGIVALGVLLPRSQREPAALETHDEDEVPTGVVQSTWLNSLASPPTAVVAPGPAQDVEQQVLARSLVARLAALFVLGRVLSDEEQREIAEIEARLTSLGDTAVAALGARLDLGKDAPGARELLFNVLRRLPGEAVEPRLVAEARGSGQPAMRTMAIESLAARPTETALGALSEIARHDAELPVRPLITTPRDPSDTSTELPDETVFSPRMQAMSALASTRHPRAVAVLADVLANGPDESLRMEAARNLEALASDPRATESLRMAAANDASPFVRLAALHALQGAHDPALAAVLEGIVARDPDAGVRILATRLLSGLGQVVSR